MTGPEHFREAERLLGEAKKLLEKASWLRAGPANSAAKDIHQRAQVHATLALAAAQVDQDALAWADALGIEV
jgi:hypothetical protein